MRQFAINIRDGRIVLCTSETLNNIDYCPISEDLVLAVKNGKLDRNVVIQKIKGILRSDPDSFDDFYKSRRAQNVHRSEITRDTIEKFQTIVQPSEVKGQFSLSDITGDNSDGDDEGDDSGDDSGDDTDDSSNAKSAKGGKGKGKGKGKGGKGKSTKAEASDDASENSDGEGPNTETPEA